jgi:hypothetical protein
VQQIKGMIKILFQILALYFLYKLIFDFIIPLYSTSKKVKQKMREFERDLDNKTQHFNSTQQKEQAQPQKPAGAKKDDYIDYEEVK